MFAGFEGDKVLDSVERYDEILNCWQLMMVETNYPIVKMACIPLVACSGSKT